VQYNFPPSSHQEQPPRAPELLAQGGARNLFRRRSERLTSATAAHGGQGVRQVDPESPGLGPRGHRAPATMTRTAARRLHLGGPLRLAVSTAHSLGPTRCCPSGFGILGS
jgi:hypothetical protein